MKNKLKLDIKADILYTLIKVKTSIRELGPAIGCNEKTIRRALQEEKISMELAIRICYYLGVTIDMFAVIGEDELLLTLLDFFPPEGLKVTSCENSSDGVKAVIKAPEFLYKRMNVKEENVMNIRCKFRCESKTKYAEGGSVKLVPVTTGSPENQQFFKWTPTGQLEFGVINDEAFKQFKPGKSYYIDICAAD